MKLTDTQLVLLSAASQRDDRAIELPANLKGGAARKVVAKLLSEGLVEEFRARGALPVWRRDDAEGAFALRTTKRGLKAIQVDDAPEVGGTEAAGEKKKSRMRRAPHFPLPWPTRQGCGARNAQALLWPQRPRTMRRSTRSGT